MRLVITAGVILALAAIPAEARIPVPAFKVMGEQFYERCTSPPNDGKEVVGVCAAYVAGIADGLSDAGQVCLGPRVTVPNLLPFALNWIRTHRANGGAPAALQIKTGLMATFPCRRIASSASQQQSSLGQVVQFGTQWIKIWQEAKPLLDLLFH